MLDGSLTFVTKTKRDLSSNTSCCYVDLILCITLQLCHANHKLPEMQEVLMELVPKIGVSEVGFNLFEN